LVAKPNAWVCGSAMVDKPRCGLGMVAKPKVLRSSVVGKPRHLGLAWLLGLGALGMALLPGPDTWV